MSTSDVKFKVDEIASVIAEEIAQYQSAADLAEVGTVLEVGDGIARVYGLDDAMAGEQVAFATGAFGQALNLEDGSVGIVVLGDYLGIKEGDEAEIWVDGTQMHLFDPSTGENLTLDTSSAGTVPEETSTEKVAEQQDAVASPAEQEGTTGA